MNWNRYYGDRIVRPGWRTSFLIPSEWANCLSHRVYGCAWEDSAEFRGYFETERAGEVVDVEVGPFATLAETKRAIESALSAEYPTHY
jgi:hypothetical protein